MGNFFSSDSTKNAEKKFDNFYNLMDYIATYYILTMDFKSLTRLAEKEYCDELVILTSDIIQRYFTDLEIEYLAQRVKNGVEVNELEKDNVIFLNRNQLDSLDVSNDVQKSIRKKRVCIGIAKFYVKIAHIFSAIIMTINPIYSYRGPDGEIVKTPFMEKDTIPKNIPRTLYKINICDNRIHALRKNQMFDDKTKKVTMQPKICDINLNKSTGQTKLLSEEPGITELMRLYLDDNYDYSTGTFTGMSNTTKTSYMKDLKTFYTAFTGNPTLPANITKFGDIKLRDYGKNKGCQQPVPFFKTSYTIDENDKLFIKYAENINQMVNNAANNQSKLLSVINDLFTYVIDPYSKKKKIRINPKLNDVLLQNSVVKTRKMIVNLYVTCETDYVNGVKLYEAIVQSKILSTGESQVANTEKKTDAMLKSVSKIAAPVPLPNNNNNNDNVTPVLKEENLQVNSIIPKDPALPPSLPGQSLSSMPSPVQPSPVQPSPVQPSPVQPLPGQPLQSMPLPGLSLPGQSLSSMPVPGQSLPGQSLSSMPLPGQPSPAQPSPAQSLPGQSLSSMPLPVQPRFVGMQTV